PVKKPPELLTKDNPPKFFYGYVIVGLSLVSLLIFGGLLSSFGVFLKEIQNETHWNRATISGANALEFFLMGVFAIISGRLVDRYGPRLIISITGVIMGIGFILTSQVSQIWQFYLAYGVIVGIGLSSVEVTALSMTARWFTKNRGLATSIIKLGNGFGMFIFPLLSSWLILLSNWRTAYIVLGTSGLLLMVSVAQFMKRDPSQIGQRPFGADSVPSNGNSASQAELTFRESYHNGSFWLVCGIYFIAWYVTQTIVVHLAGYLQDNHMNIAQAASVVSTLGAVSIAGRLIMGFAGDRIGNRNALIICGAVLLVATVWLQFTQVTWRSYIFAIIGGFAHGGFFAVLSPLVAELFGLKSHGSNLGLIIFIGYTGGAVGPVVAGRLYDMQNNYQLTFYILLGVSALCLLLTVLLKIKSKTPVGTVS
ncbi:MAG TPA: MFS transporter, partial [Dehalococcoidales bacterium]|nr:MFS transporter [Dehalococcoidales bacterium]